MLRKQITVNIKELDLKIGKLSEELEGVEDEGKIMSIMQQLDKLTELRCKLSESKENNSIKPVVVSSLFGVASLLIVLKYEEKDVITSKAFNMLPSIFRGSK